MSVRRLHSEQPATFVFSEDNLAWAKAQMAKYPEGRQASAVIPVLWRAQEQNDGWVSEPAIRYVAELLDMPNIRVLEVATFYTMFQLQPVGKKAHVQVCGTTPCMLRGSDALLKVCKSRIAEGPHQLSEDGDFSWEEVECLGACVNAPMVQIFKDTYEDLDENSFNRLLDDIAAGKAVVPGPQNGRRFGAPIEGTTSLAEISDSSVGGDPVAAAVAGQAATVSAVAGESITGGGVTRLYQPGQNGAASDSPTEAAKPAPAKAEPKKKKPAAD